jgi:hypothetical protein
MRCIVCDKDQVHELGCTVTRKPLFWCCYCGTLRTCDDKITMTPELSRQHLERVDRVTKKIIDGPPPKR